MRSLGSEGVRYIHMLLTMTFIAVSSSCQSSFLFISTSYIKITDLLDKLLAGAFTRLEHSRDSLSSYAEILYRLLPKSLDPDSSLFGWWLMDACKMVCSGRQLLVWLAKAT